MKIKACVDYDKRSNMRYFRDFEIIEKLPKEDDVFNGGSVCDIYQVILKVKQVDNGVYDYDFYEIKVLHYDDGEEPELFINYVALKKKNHF